MSSQTNLDKINNLKHGESCTIHLHPLNDVGDAEVHRIHQTLFLFEIPMYGGEPVFFGSRHVDKAQEVLDQIELWT